MSEMEKNAELALADLAMTPTDTTRINEVVALRAKVRELEQALRGMRSRWGRNKWCTDPDCPVCKAHYKWF